MIRLLRGHAPQLISLAAGAGLWQLLSLTEHLSFLPPLQDIARALADICTTGSVLSSGLATLVSMFEGLAIALAAGLVTGLVMAQVRPLEGVLGIYVNAAQAMPMAAIIPVLVIFYGLDQRSIVVSAALFAYFSICLNVYTGIKTVDARLTDMARSFGAAPVSVLRRVVLPSALPFAVLGLRIGAARAIDGAVLGEMLTSLTGIGGVLMSYDSSFRFAYVYAVLIPVFVFARALLALISWLGGLGQPWRQRDTSAVPGVAGNGVA